MGRLGSSGSQFERWHPKWAPFFQCVRLFWESKNHECVKLRKRATQNACCLQHVFLGICLLPEEKCTSQKCIEFLGKKRVLSFLDFSTTCGTLEQNEPRRAFLFHFLEAETRGGIRVPTGLGARNDSRMREGPFREGMCCLVSVVLSVSVWRAVEWSNDELNDVCFALCLGAARCGLPCLC